ncbi:MAG: SDR family NAD(P)-dependent oxidoreductase [Hamadaea sp.]|nr:SDR family NAD(P)-dependent oxidoreductase [Hamadaea sp.]
MTDDTTLDRPLAGKVALVAGATRGCGRAIAIQLGAAGATVYATGRTTRARRSEMNRPETIEETGELIEAAGGTAVAVAVDHLDPAQVRALVDRIRAEQGRLDILVNDMWGGDPHIDWEQRIWEHDLDRGLRAIDNGMRTHVITNAVALGLLVERPGGLVVEITDGTNEFNADYRGNFYYDLAKVSVNRIALALARELAPKGCTALAVTPGFLRSEAMLDHFGVTEATWRDAVSTDNPHFSLSETPLYLGRALAALAADPRAGRFAGQALAVGTLAREYGVTDADGTQPDFERYARENDLGSSEIIDDAKYR